MKPFNLLAKYYGIAILIGFLVYFYQFSYGFYSAPRVIELFNIFIIWGLIYSHLKESSGVYTTNEFLVIYAGKTMPTLLLLAYFPDLYNLKIMSGYIAAMAFLAVNFILVKGLLLISVNMVKNIPESDYDS